MQQWEYRFERNIDSDSLERLNELGNNGWELCGNILGMDILIGRVVDYCFKRPKQAHLHAVESEGLESR